MIWIVLVVVLFLVIVIVQEWQWKRSQEQRLKRMFGQKRNVSERDFERIDDIERWYRFQENSIPADENIDDVTWNDLEMDCIFTQINHTVSFVGEQYLYMLLRRLKKDKTEQRERETRIQYFDRQDEVRLKVQKDLLPLGKEAVYYRMTEIVDTIEEQKLPLAKISPVLLGSLVILVVAFAITGNEYLVAALVANFLMNITLYAMYKTKYEIYLQSIFAIAGTVRAAKAIYKDTGSQEEKVGQAVSRLEKLSKMTGMMEGKKRAAMTGDVLALFQDYLMGALMWDFIVYEKMISEIKGKRADFMTLFSFVGETDACIAIASYRRSIENYCIPSETEGKLMIKGLWHPLLENAVKNDFDCEKNVIITGSNASGKSTFIKGVAINLILAQSIHTCTAESVCMPDMGVVTSMAVRDDVMAGESYYVREIKYLKRMVEQASGNRLFFCAVDEILRGTNTKERIAASFAILKYMKEKNCILVVATHDTELAKLMDGEYENYHFCDVFGQEDVGINLEDAQNFKLQKGITETSNAILLLDIVGFPKEIIREAEKICN